MSKIYKHQKKKVSQHFVLLPSWISLLLHYYNHSGLWVIPKCS